MNIRHLILPGLAAGLALALVSLPHAIGQAPMAAQPVPPVSAPVQAAALPTVEKDAPPALDPRIKQLVAEIAAQQKTQLENQAQIDKGMAALAEEIRTARNFAGRSR